ncbi:hypothetical protein BDW22DRAFT_1482680 [Trametopsis cervina]|nr:hypothetical protein BDW22DRAFT_1482680 [Trametopsis cervina]
MLTLPSDTLHGLRRAISYYPSLLSPSWSYLESPKTLRKSTSEDQLFTRPLLWKVLPKSVYTPAEEHGASYPYAADISAELPLSSTAMFILAAGESLGNGAINIREDHEDKLSGNSLLVDMRVYYSSPLVHKSTSVSYVHAPQKESGIRIHTAPHPDELRRFLSISVRIPRAGGSDPLKLPAFRTHLPNFVHSVGDLAGVVHFSSITLSSSEKDIYVKSLSARRARLRTSNGTIRGTFSSDSAVSLRTSNAPINADITLSNDGAQPSHLELHTNYDEINVNVNLDSTAPEDKTPSYRVVAQSSNKPVHVKSGPAPQTASVHYEIQTTNAPATLHLPATYEGTFELHSSPSKPVVAGEASRSVDSARERIVRYNRERRGLVSGTVTLQDGKTAGLRSEVSIKTSNAQAQLFL